MAEPEVLITSDKSKLPADIFPLLDPTIPLPAGITFFEKKYELGEMMRNLMIAIGLTLGAIVIIPFGVAMLFDHKNVTVESHVDYWPLGFGCVMALGAWMMFVSLRTSWQLRSDQQQGQCTRRGTFLLSAALVQVSENDTTIIPPIHFRGLAGHSVKYHHNNVDKSYNLPNVLVNATPQQLQQAITRWAGSHGSLKPVS